MLAGLALLFWVGMGEAARGQTASWQTAIALTNSPSSLPEIRALATDASGNIYLAGNFVSTVTFGATSLTSAGNGDVFVAKWSPATQQFVWAQGAGGTGLEVAQDIAVSGSNVYIVGQFASPTAAFGTTTLVNSYQGAAQSSDVYIAKLTDQGASASFTWAQRGKGQYATSVAVSGASVYMAGYFGGTQAEFGALVLPNTSNQFYLDSFVVKLTDAGPTSSYVWAQQIAGAETEWIFAMAASGSNVYIGGEFLSPGASFGSVTLTNGGQGDAFVAKLTDAGSSGRFDWAQRAGGTGIERVNALAVSGASVYAVGYFNSAPAAFGATTLASIGSHDIFIAKLTDAGATGSFSWAQRAGGTGTTGTGDQAQAVVVSGASVYVAGIFYGTTADFGSTVLDSSLGNLFLTKLTDSGAAGRFQWALGGGGGSFNTAAGLGISGTRVYQTGNASTPARFGSTTIATSNGAAYLATVADPQALSAAGATAGSGRLMLWPNPAHHSTTLRVPPVSGATQATVLLHDGLGRLLATHHYPLATAGLQVELPLLGLPAGLYRVAVQAGPWRAMQALCVE